MAQTSKLGLELPAGSDYASVTDINGNMEIIDAAMPIVVYSSTEPTEDLVTGMIWLKPVASEE